MTGSINALFMALLFSSACARMRHREDPPADTAGLYPDRDANKKCEELCKVDSGMDADARDCLTECAVSTDLQTHHLDEGTDYFVKDESYNEKGGKKMKKLYNEKAPEEVVSCVPTVDLDKKPEFEDLDTNGDGVIDFEESENFSRKACVPDEMNEQTFSAADFNQDKVIDKKEFEGAGESSKNEEAMDEALEKVSEGDDEYNPVQNPPLEEFDENKDGALDESEAKDMFEHELERRTDHEDVPPEKMKEFEGEVQDAIDKVDTNDDGEIDGDEYVAKDEGSDLGQEIKEAADADEDAEELDDLSRAGGAPAAAASFTQRQARNTAAFLHKRKAKKFKQAMHEAAQARRWWREAQRLRQDAAKLRQKAAINHRLAHQ
jgi:hypothetical protein